MKKLSGLLILAALWLQCANPISPQGGPRDEIPPQLDTLHSTPNQVTRFQKQDIELFFDEWIQINNPGQVVVSPPLQYAPRIRVRGKRVIFSFDERETLRDSATYTINFGNTVADLTENNPVRDLRFIFSTGDYVDSCAIGGQVLDAYTNEPVENVTVMLYEEGDDSVVYKERPFYFARTDEAGDFSIGNIKNGRFKIFALQDENLNYLYDGGEGMGFLDSMIFLQDETMTGIMLHISEARQPRRLRNHFHRTRHLINLTFDQAPDEFISLSRPPGAQEVYHVIARDSLQLWYAPEPVDTWPLIITDGPVRDTAEIDESGNRRIRSLSYSGRTRLSIPPEAFSITFNMPVSDIDSGRISFLDSAGIRIAIQSTVDTNDARMVSFLPSAMRSGMAYQLIGLPGSFTSISGTSNDSISIAVTFVDPTNLGILTIDLQDLDSAGQYILQLESGNQVRNKVQIAEGQEQVKFTNLAPGNYSLRLITDTNRNGRWDAGNYRMKLFPERVNLQSGINVRANWEISVTIAPM